MALLFRNSYLSRIVDLAGRQMICSTLKYNDYTYYLIVPYKSLHQKRVNVDNYFVPYPCNVFEFSTKTKTYCNYVYFRIVF